MKYLVLLLIVITVSCQSEYRGYEPFTDSVHYKLISLGEENTLIDTGSFFVLDYVFCKSGECLQTSGTEQTFSFAGSLPDFWTKFHPGDEAILILDTACDDYWINLFFLEKRMTSVPLIVRFSISSVYGKSGFNGQSNNKEELMRFRESVLIQNVLDADTTADYIQKNDCYLFVRKIGEGDSVKANAGVHLSYKAFFTDGRLFDDTDNWEDSLRFTYGKPYQIIRGLETSIEHLREGCEAKIIIPSHLAFGSDGSATGLVPPYEPVIFELKIISVTKEHL